MRIEVLYRSNRLEEFDTSAMTCPEPYRSGGTNVMTDWNLELGNIERDGIVLAQHWYDASSRDHQSFVNIGGIDVPAARRRVGCAILLVDASEVGDIIWLKKDGEKLLWRLGRDLINIERFYEIEQLFYSDITTQSVSRRAIAVFDYLKNSSSDESDGHIADIMGFTVSTLERMRDAEIAQEKMFDGMGDQG